MWHIRSLRLGTILLILISDCIYLGPLGGFKRVKLNSEDGTDNRYHRVY